MSLPRLTALAEILRERELARLAAASHRAGALRSQIEALQASVRSRAAQLAELAAPASPGPVAPGPDPAADPALSGGAEGRWLLWLSHERQALQRRYLLQLAEIEDLRALSARAFGRAEVLGKLTEAQRRELCAARERRRGADRPDAP